MEPLEKQCMLLTAETSLQSTNLIFYKIYFHLLVMNELEGEREEEKGAHLYVCAGVFGGEKEVSDPLELRCLAAGTQEHHLLVL